MKNEIIFTAIADTDEDLQPLTSLIDQFEVQTNTQVKLEHTNWEKAWPNLFELAVNGGSHVAHIGSTWSGSLMGMRALRPFAPHELKDMEASDAFFGPAWQSTKAGQAKTFSMPWSTYTFVLCYRRDLLQQAGIDEESAFASSAAMMETLSRLQQTGIEFPWLYPSSFSGPDWIHLGASWVWGAGGDFISANGKKTLFNTSKSRSGLASFLDLFRFLPGKPPAETFDDCIDMFVQGRVGAMFIDAYSATEITQWTHIQPALVEQTGLAPLPGIPWVGGDNLIIWNHVYDLQLQQNCLSLVKFLTSQEAQVIYAKNGYILPARQDALPMISYPPSFTSALTQIMDNGRAHYAVPLWNRVENSLGMALNRIIAEFQDDIEQNRDALLAKHLQPLARNLDNILS